MHNSKTIQCMWILYKTTALILEIFLSWFEAACQLWLVSYDWQVATTKRSSSTQHGLTRRLLCLLRIRHGTNSQVMPRLLSKCVLRWLCWQLTMCASLEVWLSLSLITWFTWRLFSPAENMLLRIYMYSINQMHYIARSRIWESGRGHDQPKGWNFEG